MSFFSRLLGKSKPPPVLPPGQRVYAIGDIHGCLESFETLLTAIERDDRDQAAAKTTVILLGDLIDRGPDSAGVVRRAMAPLDWAELRTIRGNHEAAMIQALLGDEKALAMWLGNGGDAALRSWGIDRAELEDMPLDTIPAMLLTRIPYEQLCWLAALPLSLHIGDYFFVHAGVRPGIALDEQTEADCLWIREDFLRSRRDFGAMVVHGHTIFEEVQVRPNRISLDTGAYLGGPLTAIGIQGECHWFLEA